MEAESALLRAISLDAIIPENGNVPLYKLLEDDALAGHELTKGILNIRKRDIVFIDEKVRAVAVLQIPQCEEEELKSLLSRAEFKVEVWAFDKSTVEEQTRSQAEPAKDLVFSTTVPQVEDPIVLARQSDEDAAASVLILAWELDITLGRPRFRMQDPLLALHCAFLVSTPSLSDGKSEAYLGPFQLQESNIFEPMRHLTGLDGTPPYLAASRLERVRPETPRSQKQFRTEHTSSSYRMVAVANTRMKYTRMNTSISLPMLIASLDIEIIPILEIEAVLETANLTLLNGQVEILMPELLPMACRSRDVISLLFRLLPGGSRLPGASPITPSSPSYVDVLSLSLKLRVRMSESCQPTIHMSWTTNVDFFQALNPSFGVPNQSIQREHRPSSLALGNTVNGRASQSLNSSLQPVVNTMPPANQVTISFTAPDEPVKVGEPFRWSMLINNNSTKPAKLSVIPLPRIPRGMTQAAYFAKRHAPKSSTASFEPAERRHTRDGESDIDFAQAVVDANMVYAMQHSNTTQTGSDLVALTAEVRIGPLGSGQCHESAIEMVAFATGTFRLDAIRVVDLNREADEGISASGVVIDIRDLPDVVVVSD